jgi:hypothetical protein
VLGLLLRVVVVVGLGVGRVGGGGVTYAKVGVASKHAQGAVIGACTCGVLGVFVVITCHLQQCLWWYGDAIVLRVVVRV